MTCVTLSILLPLHTPSLPHGYDIRVKKCVPNCTSPTTTTDYIFSGSNLIAEYASGASASSPSKEYVYSDSNLLASIPSGGLTDLFGTTTTTPIQMRRTR